MISTPPLLVGLALGGYRRSVTIDPDSETILAATRRLWWTEGWKVPFAAVR